METGDYLKKEKTAPLCPTVPHCAQLCPIASQQENRRKYGHKTWQVTPIFETLLNPEPELSGESTKWHTPTHLPLGVLEGQGQGTESHPLGREKSSESWSSVPSSIFSCPYDFCHNFLLIWKVKSEGPIGSFQHSQRALP